MENEFSVEKYREKLEEIIDDGWNSVWEVNGSVDDMSKTILDMMQAAEENELQVHNPEQYKRIKRMEELFASMCSDLDDFMNEWQPVVDSIWSARGNR